MDTPTISPEGWFYDPETHTIRSATDGRIVARAVDPFEGPTLAAAGEFRRALSLAAKASHDAMAAGDAWDARVALASICENIDETFDQVLRDQFHALEHTLGD